MRRILLITLACFSFACTSTKTASQKTGLLNGSWTPVKQEIGGKDLPASYFQTQKLVILDSVYTFTAESVDQGILIYKEGKMDIYGREGVNKGKHFTALYKLEKTQLTIIYNLAGDPYPSDFETKSKPGLFMAVFNKN